MKTYIVNLPKDKDRKEYVAGVLAKYSWMDKTFIEAVYGKELSKEKTDSLFELDLAYKRYGRNLNPGEIGCTLSHHKCYKMFLESDAEWLLILEDDITILGDLDQIESVLATIDPNKPRVVFLSGDYWFTSMKKVSDKCSIANVYDAVGTYAYIINRKAAELILKKNPRPSYVADNWSLFRRQGVKLHAFYPYLIDANIEDFGSSIEQTYFGEIRKNMPLGKVLAAYRLSFVKRLLVKTNHFVSKIRR